MSEIIPVNVCQCDGTEDVCPNGSFFCRHHQCRKTQHWRDLCREDAGYRQAWNEGHGPGQSTRTGQKSAVAEPPGLGDTLASWLTAVGVTEENYKAVKQMFGLPPKCGCARRKEWLNRVGRWLKT